jgi:hypothetical protein
VLKVYGTAVKYMQSSKEGDNWKIITMLLQGTKKLHIVGLVYIFLHTEVKTNNVSFCAQWFATVTGGTAFPTRSLQREDRSFNLLL